MAIMPIAWEEVPVFLTLMAKDCKQKSPLR